MTERRRVSAETRAQTWRDRLDQLRLPALVLLVATLLVGWAISQAGGDALALARLGTRFSQGDPQGEAGYDGQFVYYIARDPAPQRVRAYLDVPAYRYQRILLPLLARLLSLGRVEWIPWALVGIGLLSLGLGTWAMQELLQVWGIKRRYALIYGLWAGFLLALIVDLPEPLAYGLVVGGLLAEERGHRLTGWLLLGLAAFAKEVTWLFPVGLGLQALGQRRWKEAAGIFLIAGLPFALFQVWLWVTFGQPGFGSGGDLATPFEWIPFMGLLRIAAYSPLYMLAMLVVFGPTVVWPAIWGIWQGVQSWRREGPDHLAASLVLNSLVIVFLPFSTFRETGALLRLASGLVVAILLFAARRRRMQALNYGAFWLVLNVFLLKQ